MPSGREVLVLASSEVGRAVVDGLAEAGVQSRALDLVHAVYTPFHFEPQAWDALVVGSIHGWRGLRLTGPFSEPCFAVGHRTAERLRDEAGRQLTGPILVPERAQAESLVELVRKHFGTSLADKRLLIPRTAAGRTVVQEALGPVAFVEAPCVYEMRFGDWPKAEGDLASAWAVVVGSGELLKQLAVRVGADGLAGRRVFVFGPAGLEAARSLGLEAEAPELASAASVAALVAARARSR